MRQADALMDRGWFAPLAYTAGSVPAALYGARIRAWGA